MSRDIFPPDVQIMDHSQNIKLEEYHCNSRISEMNIKKAYVYMLTNERGNVLDIGSTEDLKKRICLHKNRLISGFTKRYNVNKLVYFEEHTSLDSALTREKYLKGKSRAKKDILIKSMNPMLLDLTDQLLKSTKETHR